MEVGGTEPRRRRLGAAVREEWLVEDRWWTPRALRRHYFELALADGRAVTVFRDGDRRWFRQRA